MAKDKNENIISKIFAVIIFLIVLCIMLCIALLPFVLLIGVFVYRFQFINYRKNLNNDLSDFWLGHEEKNEFKTKMTELANCMAKINNAESKGNEAGISRNNDGQFSARSNLGKEIRQIFNTCLPIKNELAKRLYELQKQPLKKWKKFNSIASNSKATTITLNIWVGITLFCLILAYRKGGFEFENMYQYLIASYKYVFIKMLSLGTDSGNDLIYPLNAVQTIIFPFAGTLISFFICKGIFSDYGMKFSPEPPKVTLDNIDLPEAKNHLHVCNQNFTTESEKKKSKKKKSVAIIFAILFGIFGVHKFYLGSWGWGIVYILFFWTYFPMLVGIAEGIKFAFMRQDKFNQRYNGLPSRAFKW